MPMKASIPTLLAAVLLATACTQGEHLVAPAPPGQVLARAAARDNPPPPPAPGPVAGPVSPQPQPTRPEAPALNARLVVQPSFEEILAFPPDAQLAVTYRFRLRQGDKLSVQIEGRAGVAPLIGDVYEVEDDSGSYRQVYRTPPGRNRFTYTAERTGEHVLRLQPPAGVSGRYAVRVEGPQTATLSYPVAGMSPASIAGLYGDARDGGSRNHKGVDIFAPRGTPVVAVSAGEITVVETTSAGGRVVWQRDPERGLMYYYAHLEEQLTSVGRHVSVGDTIGLVGNSGNAKGSSTHLHFGVFRPGYEADDPTPYLLGGPRSVPVTDSASVPRELGTRVKLEGDHVRLRSSPNEAAPVLEQLAAGTDLLVLGYVNGWTRVVLEDGRAGFVAGWLIRS